MSSLILIFKSFPKLLKLRRVCDLEVFFIVRVGPSVSNAYLLCMLGLSNRFQTWYSDFCIRIRKHSMLPECAYVHLKQVDFLLICRQYLMCNNYLIYRLIPRTTKCNFISEASLALILIQSLNQRCGAVWFWSGSGSGSAEPSVMMAAPAPVLAVAPT